MECWRRDAGEETWRYGGMERWRYATGVASEEVWNAGGVEARCWRSESMQMYAGKER